MRGEPHSPAPQSPSHDAPDDAPDDAIDEAPPAGPDPDWPRAALRAFAGEWRAFVAVAVAVTLTPRRFAGEWAEGRRQALNPLACALNAYGIAVVWIWLSERVLHYQMPSLVESASEPLLKIAGAIVLASCFHFPLRWMGGRARWRTTVGAVLYTGAGPLLLQQLLTTPLSVLSLKLHSKALNLALAALALPQFAYYVLVQMGTHRLPWWRTVLALLIYFAIIGAVLTAVTVLVLMPYVRAHRDVLRGFLPDMR